MRSLADQALNPPFTQETLTPHRPRTLALNPRLRRPRIRATVNFGNYSEASSRREVTTINSDDEETVANEDVIDHNE
jgi:hypothetical protein